MEAVIRYVFEATRKALSRNADVRDSHDTTAMSELLGA